MKEIIIALLTVLTPRIALAVEQRQIPEMVRHWVESNRPGLSFPPIELFYGKTLREQDLDAFLKQNKGWPPYCIGADFNGDGRTDYALLLHKLDEKGGVSYSMVVLHGTKAGLKEVDSPIKHSMGSAEKHIDTRLIILPKGTHTGGTGNVERQIVVERDSLSAIEGFSQIYWVWTKNGYKRKSLFAD